MISRPQFTLAFLFVSVTAMGLLFAVVTRLGFQPAIALALGVLAFWSLYHRSCRMVSAAMFGGVCGLIANSLVGAPVISNILGAALIACLLFESVQNLGTDLITKRAESHRFGRTDLQQNGMSQAIMIFACTSVVIAIVACASGVFAILTVPKAVIDLRFVLEYDDTNSIVREACLMPWTIYILLAYGLVVSCVARRSNAESHSYHRLQSQIAMLYALAIVLASIQLIESMIMSFSSIGRYRPSQSLASVVYWSLGIPGMVAMGLITYGIFGRHLGLHWKMGRLLLLSAFVAAANAVSCAIGVLVICYLAF